ncbi:MAG: 23S rRNA (pseudouridine(1915)-N(3))-methyltransferase RlmH [Gammaproteobacteria bacterium]|nr:23S rRNA (pseudouridine(1915)-N(3))-methyltransferase RlmH [Gammaproteobacteria bacterium]MDH3431227.1 23S rRNA (pseudouridine(1915)-N(3))-methyltransferase RlmH [Gammaproteobacteria bacterium]MDH3433759.1 23S rRNA (pseudouridine(1915)-N(3))-methyltransferase RlmH [Gammaproteobacteria bacterium]
MHIRLIAVGDRQPSWVDEAFNNYSARFPREWKFRLDQIASARRTKKDKSGHAMQTEGEQVLARIGANEQVVLLDERGKQMTSPGLAARLADWQADGRDLCFIIGGADGVSDACRERASFTWSMSSLTLPHGLARVLFAEQMYRAWTLQAGHPYHRE